MVTELAPDRPLRLAATAAAEGAPVAPLKPVGDFLCEICGHRPVIMLVLADGPAHGYAIMLEVSRLTEGKTHLGPGTLYRTIQKLIVDRLNKELRAALADADVKKRIINEGGEPAPTTPAEHAAVIDREETKWSAVIRDAGIEPQ